MILELNSDRQKLLERAAQSGMSPEEALDQAFAVIREQHIYDDWILAERDAITAQIAEGFEQAERGDLIEAEQAARLLKDRREKRRIA
jgi:predicted transcriptional regulator